MAGFPIPEPPGFSELTKAEQVRYLQTPWDQVSQAPGDLPVPANHLELAEARLVSHRRDPSGARPAHDVLDRRAKKSR